MKPTDMAGKHYSFWIVKTYAGNRRWIALCTKCGQLKNVAGIHLRKGMSKMCRSCFEKEKYHGYTFKNSRTYRIWQSMKRRCDTPTNIGYPNYGGRGITVCERWKHSFLTFLADMGECPASMSIERKNNDGNYEPSNCSWATQTEQARNKQTSRRVLCNGKEMIVRDAAIELRLPYTTLLEWLNRNPKVKCDVSDLRYCERARRWGHILQIAI